MTKLIDVIHEAGFTAPADDIMYAIVLAESQGNAWAFNPNRDTGDRSYGLAQINMIDSLGPARREEYNLKSNEDLFDPATNLRVAYAMSGHGEKWSDWSTFNRGEHEQYLNSDHSHEVTFISEGGSPHTDETPVPAPTPAPHPVTHGSTYTVESGDTLSAIGAAVHIDWHTLYAWNASTIGPDPDVIQPGQVLRLTAPAPHPSSAHGLPHIYVVNPGDNLSAIAEHLGVDWHTLYAVNRAVIGPDPDLIQPGQRLVIPS